MGIISCDQGWTVEDLALLYDPVEIEDSHGKLIGVFVPANLERCREEYARQWALVDEAELDRREAECERIHLRGSEGILAGIGGGAGPPSGLG